MSLFKETLLKNLHIDTMAPEQQAEVLEAVGEIVIMAVVQRAIGMMSPEDCAALDALVDTHPSPDAVFQFLSTRIQNLEAIIQEEGREAVEMASAFMDGAMDAK